jgi:hypothetical protein
LVVVVVGEEDPAMIELVDTEDSAPN